MSTTKSKDFSPPLDELVDRLDAIARQQREAKLAPANGNSPPELTFGLDSSAAPMDSGRAWLMLGLMFLINSTVGGSSRVYGLIYAKQVSIGYYDHQAASWPIATASSVENLAGILTPALAQFLSWRQIQLLSTSLFVLANLGAYFSRSLSTDILCLGIIQGLALSMCTLLTLAINNHYFERFKTTAYGLAMCGGTCGILYLGPLINWILERDENSFRVAYLVLALIFMLNYPLSLLVVARPQETPPQAADRPTMSQHLSAARKRSFFESHFERKQSVASISVECKLSRQSTLSRCSCGWLHKAADTAAAQPGTSPDKSAPSPRASEQATRKLSTVDRQCPGPQLITSAATLDFRQLSKAPMGVKRQPREFPTDESAGEKEVKERPKPRGTEADFSLSQALKLVRSPYLHCVWLMLTLYYLVSRIFIIVLADFAVDHGIGPEESAGLLNFWSAGEVFGRILLCSFVDLRWLSVRHCISLTCGSLGAVIALMVHLEGYFAYAGCLLLIAALASLECVLINVLIIEYLGKSQVTSCYSMGSLMAAPLLLMRPTLIGFFRDQLGSYDGLLVLLAAFSISFALLFALLQPLASPRRPNAQPTCEMAAHPAAVK